MPKKQLPSRSEEKVERKALPDRKPLKLKKKKLKDRTGRKIKRAPDATDDEIAAGYRLLHDGRCWHIWKLVTLDTGRRWVPANVYFTSLQGVATHLLNRISGESATARDLREIIIGYQDAIARLTKVIESAKMMVIK